MAAPHFLKPLIASPGPGYALRNRRTGEMVATRLEIAADSKSRRRGLLGRASLASDSALIIAPCNSIHTFFMQFAIDVAFVSRAGVVVGISRALKPWRMAMSMPAFATIELAADVLAASRTEVGDELELIALSS